MIHHSVLVDVSSKILNGKDRIMYKGIIVVSINTYALNSNWRTSTRKET